MKELAAPLALSHVYCYWWYSFLRIASRRWMKRALSKNFDHGARHFTRAKDIGNTVLMSVGQESARIIEGKTHITTISEGLTRVHCHTITPNTGLKIGSRTSISSITHQGVGDDMAITFTVRGVGPPIPLVKNVCDGIRRLGYLAGSNCSLTSAIGVTLCASRLL